MAYKTNINDVIKLIATDLNLTVLPDEIFMDQINGIVDFERKLAEVIRQNNRSIGLIEAR